MTYELTRAQKDNMLTTIDDFVNAQNPDQKIIFLGQLGKFIEDQGYTDSFAMNTTVALLYARLADQLDKDLDKYTFGILNRVMKEYLDRSGLDTD